MDFRAARSIFMCGARGGIRESRVRAELYGRKSWPVRGPRKIPIFLGTTHRAFFILNQGAHRVDTPTEYLTRANGSSEKTVRRRVLLSLESSLDHHAIDI